MIEQQEQPRIDEAAERFTDALVEIRPDGFPARRVSPGAERVAYGWLPQQVVNKT
jgi:hypothetical protein